MCSVTVVFVTTKSAIFGQVKDNRHKSCKGKGNHDLCNCTTVTVVLCSDPIGNIWPRERVNIRHLVFVLNQCIYFVFK